MTYVDNRLTGSAGEHFVCSGLAQSRWAASLTREGVAHADVLAVQSDHPRRMIEVQVKTMRFHRRPMYLLGAHWMRPAASDREWYAFVLLGRTVRDRPRCWVVPRDHVTAAGWLAHMHWMTDPAVAVDKRERRKTPLKLARVGIEVWDRYEDRWDLLAESAYDAPVLLPVRMRELIPKRRIAFPAWHPWKANGVPAWEPEQPAP